MSNASTITGYNLLALRKTEIILERFSEAGIQAILLKGIALLCDVYDDPSERILGDVDILVRPKDFDKAKDVLKTLGFAFIHGNMVNAEVYGTEPPGEVFVDLHRHLFNPESPSQEKIYRPDEDSIWERAQSIRCGDQKALVLSPEDRIVYLCFHILKERFSDEKWLNDISLFLRKKEDEIDEQEFIRIGKRSGTYKLCALVIDYLRTCENRDIRLLQDASPWKEYFLYKAEGALFRLLIRHNINLLRESFWILSMDSCSRKMQFLWHLLGYMPRKLTVLKQNSYHKKDHS